MNGQLPIQRLCSSSLQDQFLVLHNLIELHARNDDDYASTCQMKSLTTTPCSDSSACWYHNQHHRPVQVLRCRSPEVRRRAHRGPHAGPVVAVRGTQDCASDVLAAASVDRCNAPRARTSACHEVLAVGDSLIYTGHISAGQQPSVSSLKRSYKNKMNNNLIITMIILLLLIIT